MAGTLRLCGNNVVSTCAEISRQACGLVQRIRGQKRRILVLHHCTGSRSSSFRWTQEARWSHQVVEQELNQKASVLVRRDRDREWWRATHRAIDQQTEAGDLQE